MNKKLIIGVNKLLFTDNKTVGVYIGNTTINKKDKQYLKDNDLILISPNLYKLSYYNSWLTRDKICCHVKIVNHGHYRQPAKTCLDLTHHSDANYNPSTEVVAIDLNLCKQGAKTYKIDFYEYVARCLNHEYIHHLINIIDGDDTTRAFDKIAKKYIDYWMW